MSSEKFVVVQTDSSEFNPTDFQVFSIENILNYQQSLQVGSKISVKLPWSLNKDTPIVVTGKIYSTTFGNIRISLLIYLLIYFLYFLVILLSIYYFNFLCR